MTDSTRANGSRSGKLRAAASRMLRRPVGFVVVPIIVLGGTGPLYGLVGGGSDRAAGVEFEICTVASECTAGSQGGLGGQFHTPFAAAATDAVYVADFISNRVQKFDRSGHFERAWGKDVISSGPDDNGTGFEICMAAKGDVCKAGSTGGLGGAIDRPAGIAVDSAGHVFVADQLNNRIQRFDAEGNFQRAWGKDVVNGGGTGFEICVAGADSCQAGVAGDLGGELNKPQEVATDAAGNVYVADFGNNRVQKFDSSGNFERAWGKDVVNGNGNTEAEICVATSGDTCKAGVVGGYGGEFNQTMGVATDGTSNVYVTDLGDHRVQEFDTSGNFKLAWGKDVVNTNGYAGVESCELSLECKAGTSGTLGGEFNQTVGIAADGSGNVFVADQLNNRIQRFDAEGNFQRAWGKDVVNGGGTGFEICTLWTECKAGVAGGLGGEMSEPYGLATDTSGGVYLADAANERIQVFDSSGNFQSAWGKDVVYTPPPPPPDLVTITSGPSGITNDSTPGWTFTPASGATVSCSISTSSPHYGSCTGSTSHTSSKLSDGTYTFTVRATLGGSTDTDSRGFILVTKAPTVKITRGPSGRTTDNTPSFQFSHTGYASMSCSISKTSVPHYGPCTSSTTYMSPELANGSYTFTARATAGSLMGTASRRFTVDAKAVKLVTITSGPDGPTNDSTPSFHFTHSSRASVTCSIYKTSTPKYGPCTSSNGYRSPKLADGSYKFSVFATLGVQSANDSRKFRVDTKAPKVKVKKHPPSKTSSRNATFSFRANEQVRFSCRLDRKPAVKCASPTRYRNLTPGMHTFRLEATDAAGNQKHARWAWKIMG